MSLKQKALDIIAGYSEKYSEIDPLIEPLCNLLTQHDYITMHSCSTHIKVRSFRLKDLASPDVKLEDPNKRIHHAYDYWYVLFVTELPTLEIKEVVDEINKKYNYNMEFYRTNDYEGITHRYVIRIEKPKVKKYKNEDIYELNKNIYLEFKKHFDRIDSL